MGPKRAKLTVQPEITVGLVVLHRVMNPVHVRRDDEPAAKTAIPTAAAGNSSRSTSVLRTTSPKLLAQRMAFGTDSWRLGAKTSHSATTAKTPTKKPRRMLGSWLMIHVSKLKA